MVRALSQFGDLSQGTSAAEIDLGHPEVLNLSAGFVDADFRLTWDINPGRLDLSNSVVRYGSSFDSGTPVPSDLREAQWPAKWLGERKFWVKVRDVAGTFSPAESVVLTVEAPGAPVLTSSAGNMQTMIQWEEARKSLPIARTIVVRTASSYNAPNDGVGESWSVLGTSLTIRERFPGQITYTVKHVDTAGNEGVSQTVTVEVSNAGVPTVDNAASITAAAGSPPPGGEDWWAVFDRTTGKIWRWIKASGKYSKAADGGDLMAASVAADKIAVASLSALSASLGYVISGQIDLAGGGGWQYLRTYGKWFGSQTNGFVWASNPSTNSHFHEFYAAHNGAVFVDQRGAGPDLGGAYYYTYVKDSSGVERLVIDPQNGIFKLRGHVEALSGTFTGTLTADAVNAVRRVNIAGEAVVIPRTVAGAAMTFAPSSLDDGEWINCVIFAEAQIPITSDYVKSYDDGEGNTIIEQHYRHEGRLSLWIGETLVRYVDVAYEKTNDTSPLPHTTLWGVWALPKGTVVSLRLTDVNFNNLPQALEAPMIMVQGCAR